MARARSMEASLKAAHASGSMVRLLRVLRVEAQSVDVDDTHPLSRHSNPKRGN